MLQYYSYYTTAEKEPLLAQKGEFQISPSFFMGVMLPAF